ncbi:MAG: glycoside hydrolase 100 family protein [Candidatus Euphemobacter frigidus]|nr:glycoside hydrolase 100 family protein [Candidatus Euphemobacter frigidus]MDP8276072.1 glycoside hydrolase 100 family protein [Candidatus Euphemobacter frigidus]
MNTREEETLCRQAYHQALRMLGTCARPRGMTASARPHGYPQVWARDSMITLMGAVLAGDREINLSLKACFKLLTEHQTPLGLILNNVHIKGRKPNFQAYADGGLWLIIGSANFFQQTGDEKFLKQIYPALRKALTWYEHQDVDRTGLITMAEGADWEDLFAVRGKGLYVNLLYYLALRKAGWLAVVMKDPTSGEICRKRAETLKRRINRHFWYRGKADDLLPHLKPSLGTETFTSFGLDSLGRKLVLPEKRILKKSSYYLPYLTFRDFGEWFDSFGNLLAILSGVAGKDRSLTILDLIKKFKLDRPGPLKSLHPPVLPGEKDWRYYYTFGDLNLPHNYHNGGIWPFLGGFYVAALVKMKKYREAEETLTALARLNKRGKNGPWEFNEWFQGETGQPRGMAGQAWSAGMYIYAREAVRRRKPPFF